MKGFNRVKACVVVGLFFVGNIATIVAQEQCIIPQDKKLNKLAVSVVDTTETLPMRLSNAKELVEKAPNSIWALYHKTELQYWRNWSLQKPVKVLEDELMQVRDTCPYEFPMVYYYLGNIAYLKEDPEGAKRQYQEFIRKSRGDDRVPQIRLNEAQESIRVLDFRNEIETRNYDIDIYPLTGINSTDQEYLPAISPDNMELFVTRKSREERLGEFGKVDVEKLVVATRKGESNDFSVATPLEYPFNNGKGNYGGMSTSITGKEIFLTVCNRLRSGYANCDLLRSEKKVSAVENDQVYYFWEKFDTLSSAINKPDSWESQPSLSSDGSYLLFAKYSDFTNGIDIYISERDSLGNWMEARPLGGQVNSAGNEKAPFLHPDGNTLYFASDGHLGLGGYDLFMSKKEDGVWQKPVNLGKPINSENDEHGLIVSTDGKFAYFASNTFSKTSADYDVFSFNLPQDLKPEEVLVYKGFVDNPADGAELELTTVNGKKVKNISVASGDGMYATILKKKDLEEPLVATVKKKGYAFSSELLQLENAKNGLLSGDKLELKEIKTGEPYRINDINFASNSFQLSNEVKAILKRFAAFLELNASYNVEIRGHTDNVGGASANKELSVKRALAVKNYLLSINVSKNRLSHKGFGQDMPLESNDTELGKARNRRTEFVLSKP